MCVGVLAVLGNLGFNMSTALAGLGIGGLAIGFGAQQTIANLFGGVSVLGDEVFRVGDVCRFGDRTGVVEDIGLRSTRIRTEERTLVAIPNGTVATINLENLSRRDKILFKTTLGLRPESKAGPCPLRARRNPPPALQPPQGGNQDRPRAPHRHRRHFSQR